MHDVKEHETDLNISSHRSSETASCGTRSRASGCYQVLFSIVVIYVVYVLVSLNLSVFKVHEPLSTTNIMSRIRMPNIVFYFFSFVSIIFRHIFFRHEQANKLRCIQYYKQKATCPMPLNNAFAF